MGVPVKVVLDVPPDIAAELATETLVRVGSVVRDAANGQIVTHLKEARLPAKEAANGVAHIAQQFLSTTGVKIGVGILVAGTVATVGTFTVGSWINRRRAKALNAALKAYLEAAQVGEVTVEVIDNLSGAINAANGSGSNDTVQIAEQVVNLVESHTVALAQANKTT